MKKLLWSPSEIENSQAWKFMQEVNQKHNLKLKNFHELYEWSCQSSEHFWDFFLDFSSIIVDKGSSNILKNGANLLESEWFPDAKLNFAENLLSRRDDSDAVIFWGEDHYKTSLTYNELYSQVANLSIWLRGMGVKKGDRIAGFLPNMPEAIVSMLATSSLGAIWTSCSPDFGVQSVLDRFGQVEPKVFICVDAYLYNGKVFNCLEKNQSIILKLPSIERTILVRYVDDKPINITLKNSTNFDDIVNTDEKYEDKRRRDDYLFQKSDTRTISANISSRFPFPLRTVLSYNKTQIFIPMMDENLNIFKNKIGWTSLGINGSYAFKNNSIRLTSGLDYMANGNDDDSVQIIGFKIGGDWDILNNLIFSLKSNIRFNKIKANEDDGIDNDNDGKIDNNGEVWSTSNSGTVLSINYRF